MFGLLSFMLISYTIPLAIYICYLLMLLMLSVRFCLLLDVKSVQHQITGYYTYNI